MGRHVPCRLQQLQVQIVVEVAPLNLVEVLDDLVSIDIRNVLSFQRIRNLRGVRHERLPVFEVVDNGLVRLQYSLVLFILLINLQRLFCFQQFPIHFGCVHLDFLFDASDSSFDLLGQGGIFRWFLVCQRERV